MCVIVDNNVRGEVFGQDTQTAAGKFFLDSLGRNRQLVVGGKLLQELSDQRGLHGSNAFSRWLRTAIRLGHAKVISKNRVDTETLALQSQAQCRSNDEHIIALARVSGGAAVIHQRFGFAERLHRPPTGWPAQRQDIHNREVRSPNHYAQKPAQANRLVRGISRCR